MQNYIDDTGVQVADVIVGFRSLEHLTPDDVKRIADTTRFDYYCWDLYSRVTEWYEQDTSHLARRSAALHDLEEGSNDTAAIGAFVADRIVRAHLATMARLNIAYNLLTHESDIVRLKFWARAFELLEEQGAVFLQTEGNSHILASPRLRAAAGKMTSLRVGTEVPIPVTTFTATSTSGSNTFSPATSFGHEVI